MSIFISSDFHYGHTNICGPKVSSWGSGYRDFDSVKEMNEAIVGSVNANVKRSDTLYFLGDWSFGGKDNVWKLREQLVVENIIFIRGNHDKSIDEYKHLFKSISNFIETYINNKMFVMCHYALRVWNKSHRGSLHCYGHSHHSLPEIGKSMDVGWCKYRRPLDIEEVIEILSKRDILTVDHHKGNME